MPSAAFFDLDKTILAKSSVLAFAGPLFEAKLLTRMDVTRSAYSQFAFSSGRADHSTMERMRSYLSSMVAGWNVATLQGVVAANLTRVVSPLLYNEAAALLREHQEAGHEVIIVSSTGEDIAVPIGQLLGVDHVMATRMVEQDGHYTGEIADYMYAERKAAAMREYAAAQGYDLADCYAYSDSGTDRWMLEAVGHPYAVNADRDLRRLAIENGWPLLEFRQSGPLQPASHRATLLWTIGAATATVAITAAAVVARRRRNWPSALPSKGFSGYK
ncbi:MAG: HAD family hydrolase [Propionibacteriaceae bacterium]